MSIFAPDLLENIFLDFGNDLKLFFINAVPSRSFQFVKKFKKFCNNNDNKKTVIN